MNHPIMRKNWCSLYLLLAFVQGVSLQRRRAEMLVASNRRPHGHVAIQAVSVKRKGAVWS